MNEIQPVLASRHKADFGTRFAPDLFIQFVGMLNASAAWRCRSIKRASCLMRSSTKRIFRPPFWHVKLRRHKATTMRITVHNGGDLNGVFHRLQPDPDTRKPRQRIGIQARNPSFPAHPQGTDDGHIGIDHGKLGLMQHVLLSPV